MVFSSTLFLLFLLPLTLICYYNPFWKSRKFKNIVLLIVSIGFYAWGEPLFVFIMLLSIFINWVLAIFVDKQKTMKKRKNLLVIAVGFNILLLFVFKYLSFVVRNIALLFNSNISLNIILPIGISFFTFQIMSYVFDVYYQKVQVQKNIINIALYVSMFPQLIAGPIVRYETIEQEINNRHETLDGFTNGMIRFIIGFGKKILIANYTGFIADKIFSLSGNLSVASAWLGAVSYSIQIFFDFSAYSDMAIGLGLMFGFHFLENFNYPYMAKSITDFWRRWHISLSTWFRDYVYIPLGGNRVSKSLHIFNLFIVWFLTGVWHGANWTFIVWGLYYFLLLVIEKFIHLEKIGGGHLYALIFIIIGWVLFKSESITSATIYLGSMFGYNSIGLFDQNFFYYFLNCKWILLCGIILSTPIIPYIKTKLNFVGIKNSNIYRFISFLGLIFIFGTSLIVCIKSSYNPFIYFNF
jgi:D-alanyl-lipoteichoic acid acyltransferase DltB (MBOAT superfamily)